MTQNEQLVFDFYTAFQNRDAQKMGSFYTTDVVFEDPGFGQLKGNKANQMWAMLCEASTDLKIEFSITSSSGNVVNAHWEAWYTFSKTGRPVHNKIDATFTMENGKITSHIDSFNLWSWSSQAMGVTGYLLGWSSFFRKKLHQTTGKMLSKYMANS